MPTNDQPAEDELRFLKEMGMTEIEPGRWSSGWQGSDPDMQERFDNLGGAGEEQLDLLTRAGRLQNEFDLEQTGAGIASNVQLITEGPLAALSEASTKDMEFLRAMAEDEGPSLPKILDGAWARAPDQAWWRSA